MNRYPAWKYALVAAVIVLGAVYASPNLFGDDPSVQVSSSRGTGLESGLVDSIEQTLVAENLRPQRIESAEDRVLIRYEDPDYQVRAADVLKEELGDRYTVALNLAPATPAPLRAFNARPMVLGLDLQGGVHFLMEVDMQAALKDQRERYVGDIRDVLREDRIRYESVRVSGKDILVALRDPGKIDSAMRAINAQNPDLEVRTTETDQGKRVIRVSISEQAVEELKTNSLQQNMTTLRSRVNELGVAEPVIQQQGNERIVVQLPGVQDTAEAKRILGATATLEYRPVDEEHDPYVAANTGRMPAGSRLYYTRAGEPVLLKKRIIVSGDQLVGASSGFDPQTNAPMVTVTLNSAGARRMLNFTTENVGNGMAVVFIEQKTVTAEVDGEQVRRTERTEEVISVATIREPFGKRFQTTGLQSSNEAAELALLLRAGALAAPVEIIEERTVGPSLGQDNIDQGFRSVVLGFILVLIFMAVYYRIFGLFANVALLLNLVLVIAVLSLFGATLTLPGIAGIVLTVGMAVDANVLIFQRIREELKNGNTPQNSIRAGYDKAFSTIADANVTTLIAALVLFSFGTGPIKGFAVTLSIGILTSMFTAIMVTRSLVNLTYGRRQRLRSLAI